MQKLFIILIMVSISTCYSQEEVGNLGDKVAIFLNEKGEFGSQGIDKKLIYIVDAVKMQMVDKRKQGVYRIGVTSSHAKTYFVLLSSSDTTFLEMNELDRDLEILADFLLKSKVYSNNENLSLIKSYIDTNRKNQEVIPWD